MTELQNNDLVSKLGAASPVEPTQANQINLSDSEGKAPANQASLNENPSTNTTVSPENIGIEGSLPTEDATNAVDIPPAEKPISEISNTEETPSNNQLNSAPTVIPNNNVVTTSPVSANANIKTGSIAPNNITTQQINNNGAVAGNSVNKIVNADSQKVSNISKKNSKTEYWKGLASGVLISVGLVIIGLVLFDNGSLLASVTNSIGLTNNDNANEAVNIEDALAFGDSVSNSYVDDIMGNSEDEATDTSEIDDSELEVQSGDEENLNSNEVNEDEPESNSDNDLSNDEDLDDEELDDEELDEDKTDLIVEKSADDTKVVTKNDGDDSSSNTEKSDDNSSKNKMAGSIVSIFDDTEDDSESDEQKEVDSSEEAPSILYKHVDKVEDANWVMSANCESLHCGDISNANPDELVLCTEFRQSDKLDDNSNRIGSNGICRYKDDSELVHIEL